MNVVLAIVAGIGIGFFLGEQYLLWKMRTGAILPVNPYSLPVMGNDDPNIGTVMTKKGARIVKLPTEQGAVNTIKNPPKLDTTQPEEPKYI